MPREISVAKLEDFTDSAKMVVTVDEESFVLIRVADGRIFALENRCSHQDVELVDGEVDTLTITCPAHGAKFDIVSGKPLCLPAVKPVRTYPVAVRGNEVFVTVE